MFEIDENNLPVVRTRQAFLALDLQNDFVATGSILHVNDPPNFVENIVNVAAHFRNHGNVIWVQTVYKASRPVNLTYADSEKVITATALLPDNQIDESSERVRPRPSGRRLGRYNKVAEANGKEVEDIADLRVDEREMDEMSETYLTVEEGQMPQIVLPASPGTNICQAVANSIDGEKDLIFQKSHYSAFKDGSLVQILRAKFVTEIYICGVLTNISVFATAMDAARYGYAITILDDCLGYRSKTRHDLALKMLGDFAGCEIIASSDLIDNLQRNFVSNQTTSNIRSSRTDSSLENLLSSLSLKPASSSGRLNTATAVSTSESRPKSLVDPIEKAKSTTKLLEAEGKKRERVKTKIRTRKRHAEPVSKTSATLMAASQVFEDISTPDETQTSLNSAIETIKADQHELECPSLELAHVKELDESVSNASNPKSGPLCEGDTTVIWDLLNEDVSDGIFDRLRDEALWQKMSHQGGDVPRLVSVQGQVAEDGSIPIYRHPADESPPLLPFSPTVQLIQIEVEKQLGHAVNHVLIQYYRDGTDYISEHSDKTLDITPNTYIANISLGAQRTMVFRTKKAIKKVNATAAEEPELPRKTCRAALPHNSLCRVGLVTNMRWLHSIRQDKRLISEKSEAELAYNGARISLTFRLIGTFLDKDQHKIWGQGATSKTREGAQTVINGDTAEAREMIQAFGQENHLSQFDWAAVYGRGFDVLHISNAPNLFLSGDSIADFRVKILLELYDIAWKEGKFSPSFNWNNDSSVTKAPSVPERLPVKFVDNDLNKSTVTGDLAIMLYLDSVYGPGSRTVKIPQVDLARQFTRFYQASELLQRWRAIPFSIKPFRRELALWEVFASEAAFIAGATASLADYVLFPILDDMEAEWGPGACEWENLSAYFERMKDLDCVKKAKCDIGDSKS